MSSRGVSAWRAFGGVGSATDSEFSESIWGGKIPVVVGGYSGLAALATVRTALEIKPVATESVKFQQETLVETGSAALPLNVEADSFVRGATGSVYFTLLNRPLRPSAGRQSARGRGQRRDRRPRRGLTIF